MVLFLELCNSPDLYCSNFQPYFANGAESLGISIISWIYWFLPYLRYTLPIYFATHIISKKPISEAFIFLTKTGTFSIGLILAAYLLKGFGRSYNNEYLDFFNLRKINSKSLYIRGYDYDINYDSIDYALKNKIEIIKGPKKSYKTQSKIFSKLIVDFLGMFLVYPGATSTFKKAQNQISCYELKHKIDNFNITSYVLQVDNSTKLRALYYNNRKGLKSSKIIVYFSGNAETMELSPFPDSFSQTDYDYFVYNRPGFGSSSGMPWPSIEANAVNTVMEFVINVLGYEEENIIFYGWSIGGFSASIASFYYPQTHGLIIDGSFDSILNIGRNIFPEKWIEIIECAVNKYLPIHTTPYFTYSSSSQKNFVVIIRAYDQVMTKPTETGEIILPTSRTVQLALQLLSISYKQYFINQSALDYARQILSDYKKYKKIMLQPNKGTIDKIIEKHIVIIPASHEEKIQKKFMLSIFNRLNDNKSNLSNGYTL